MKIVNHISTASLLLAVPLAAGCRGADAETPPIGAAHDFRVFGVAGNCPGHAPMRPASAGAMADVNGDGYVCTAYVLSIAGDTMRIAVDNDVAPDSAWFPEPYIGM